MDGVYCTENLQAKTECGGKRESATGLSPAEFSQIFSLQLHHHVVESVIAATANEATHMLLPWMWQVTISKYTNSCFSLTQKSNGQQNQFQETVIITNNLIRKAVICDKQSNPNRAPLCVTTICGGISKVGVNQNFSFHIFMGAKRGLNYVEGGAISEETISEGIIKVWLYLSTAVLPI